MAVGHMSTGVDISGRYLPAQIFSSTILRPSLRDLEGVVARSIKGARAAGRDYMAQTRAAASAVQAVRPDLTLVQALDAVERLRDLDLSLFATRR